jgi:hypothetical protein
MTRLPRPETLIGLGILGILVAIAAIVWTMQGRFDPERYRYLAPGSVAAASPPGQVSELALPEGARPLGPTEGFDAVTLSDKINGKAEFYLSAGFLSLRCVRLAPAEPPKDAWLEACVYDMGHPDNAYSVFSRQRRAGAPDAGLGNHSYDTGTGVIVADGRWYIEVMQSGPDEELSSMSRDFVRTFLASPPADDTEPSYASPSTAPGSAASPAGRPPFPDEDRAPDDPILIATSAFGFDRLDRVWLARYRIGDKDVTAFLSRRASPAEAADLSRAFIDMLESQGAAIQAPAPEIPTALTAEAFGLWEIAFSAGPWLAGVHEAPSRVAAVTLAARMFRTLEKEAK